MEDLLGYTFTAGPSPEFSYEGMLAAMKSIPIPVRPDREQMKFDGHGVSIETLRRISEPADERMPVFLFGIRVEVVNTFNPGYYQFWEGPNGSTLRVESEDQYRVARIKQLFGDDFFEPSFMPSSSFLCREEITHV